MVIIMVAKINFSAVQQLNKYLNKGTNTVTQTVQKANKYTPPAPSAGATAGEPAFIQKLRNQ